MDILRSCMQNQGNVFVIINILEFAMGLLLCLIPMKKAWQEYLVCAYGGFLFGAFPAYDVSESILFMVACSVILAAGLCLVQYLYRDGLYLPVLVVLAKGIFILGSMILYEMDNGRSFYQTVFAWSMEEFFPLAVFLSVIAYVAMNFVINLAKIRSHVPLALFGAMELCGAAIQLYRADDSAFDKLLHDREGTSDILFYILKVDFSYFDEGAIFVMGLLAILAGYFLWNKIFQAVLAAYVERKRKEGSRTKQSI